MELCPRVALQRTRWHRGAMTSSERWERLNVIFHEATGLDPARRDLYLTQACGEDEELRSEAERLIIAHESADRFIETPIIAVHSIWQERGVDEIAQVTICSTTRHLR